MPSPRCCLLSDVDLACYCRRRDGTGLDSGVDDGMMLDDGDDDSDRLADDDFLPR